MMKGCRNHHAILRILCFGALFTVGVNASAQIYSLEWSTTQQPHVYRCDCTLAEFDSLTLPTGYQLALRSQVASTAFEINSIPPQGVVASFVSGGFTFNYIATLINNQNLGAGSRILSVQRDTLQSYNVGSVAHELTDPDGAIYTLIAADVQWLQATGLSIEDLDAFSSISLPTGWTYSSRVLSNQLELDSGGLATVYSNNNRETLWELTPSPVGSEENIPIPPLALLVMFFAMWGVGLKKVSQR